MNSKNTLNFIIIFRMMSTLCSHIRFRICIFSQFSRVFYRELNGVVVGSDDFLFGELNVSLAVTGMRRSTQVILGTAIGFTITFHSRWLLSGFLLFCIFAITVLFLFQNKQF